MRFTILVLALLGASAQVWAQVRPAALVAEMTLEEKVGLLNGTGFATRAIPRLGIPALKMTDGPLGVRWEPSTSFPSGLSMAASFDRELVRQVTGAMGREARAEGRDVLLGPCVGFTRVPFGGRNFEGMGEDPFLTSEIAAWYIRGLHDEKVGASVKHFALNDQEFERTTINSVADERTMHEIHFVPFERAVKEGVDTVMASYNLINGHWASENDVLLNQVLKGSWGFKGFVVSDWGATHSVEKAARAGLDLEMPTGVHFATELLKAVREGRLPESLIDDKVRRIVGVIENLGLLDGLDNKRPSFDVVNSPEHQRLALRMAEGSHVLLKNEASLLPLDTTKIRRIAVIGPTAGMTPTGGGGSSHVDPRYSVSILDGIRQTFAGKAEVLFAPANADLQEAADYARAADVVVLAVGLSSWDESEGYDRGGFDLAGQDDIIKAVLAANPRTVVVVNAGNPFDMRGWIADASTIVWTSFAGQETGRALANLVTGKVNFSGRLPFTMLKRWEDSPAYGTYPKVGNDVVYSEGIYLGYRHFDKRGVEPWFPFGHGLSYTTFTYGEPTVRARSRRASAPSLELRLTVRNSGQRAGAEVVQVYVEDLAPKIDRPLRELKGFARVELAAGESREVVIPLDHFSFAYWDVVTHAWKANPGRYRVHVGSSSRDLRVTKDVVLR